jgi:methyl-accepting chemotaxis protein
METLMVNKETKPDNDEDNTTDKAAMSNAVFNEVRNLINDVKAGKLAARANLRGMNGADKELLEGINEMLDAVIDPLNVAAEYVDRISKGDIPEKITNDAYGDFNEIKNNLNTCIDAVNELVADANLLAKAAVEGRLETRADVSKHGGDFARIVEGVNQTLDAVIDPLKVAAEYVHRISKGDIPEKITKNSNGDFNEIKNNLNTCIDAVNELVADANMLATAAVEGRLETRADVSKHAGDFAWIVQGVNQTLDAVIEPIKEATEVLEEMEKGNLHVRVQGNYQGDHNLVKNALNGTLNSLQTYVN